MRCGVQKSGNGRTGINSTCEQPAEKNIWFERDEIKRLLEATSWGYLLFIPFSTCYYPYQIEG